MKTHGFFATITRDSLNYWLFGDGHWQTKLYATGQDVALCAATVACCGMMIWYYLFFGYQNHKALKLLNNDPISRHIRDIRNVVVIGCFIHVLNGMVTWIVPMHWASVALMLVNIAFCHRLIHSKDLLLSIQQQQIKRADEIESSARLVLYESDHEQIRQHLQECETLLKRVC